MCTIPNYKSSQVKLAAPSHRLSGPIAGLRVGDQISQSQATNLHGVLVTFIRFQKTNQNQSPMFCNKITDKQEPLAAKPGGLYELSLYGQITLLL